MNNSLVIPENKLQPTLDQNPAAVYLARLAPGSRATMRHSLDKIAAMLTNRQANALCVNWAAIRFQHTAAIRSQLASKYAAANVNKMLSALRGVLKAAWRLELMTADDYQRAADSDPVIGSTLPAGRALTAGEITALIEACMNDASAAGARDAAIFVLLRAGGLRRAEICTLTLADYNPEAQTLIIHGKRNKERELPITGGTAAALGDWLKMRGDWPGPLFCPVNKGGRVLRKGMAAKNVYDILQKRATQAGVKNCSPHDFRRTFVSDLLDSGADISTVQRLAGHENVQTTARYDRRGEAAKRKAVELLYVPYQKRLI